VRKSIRATRGTAKGEDARDVETVGFAGASVRGGVGRQAPPAQPHRGEGERDVDEEDGPPAAETDEEPPEGRPDHRGHLDGDGEHGEDPAGTGYARAVGLAADEVHRGGVPGAGADPDEDSGQDEDAEAGGDGAEQPGEADQGTPEEVEPARPVAVDQPADDRLADRGREVETGDEPHRVGWRGAER
jgi:hypothetical protein